jgi:hypothetical protein
MNILALLKSYLILRLYWHYCSWNSTRSLKVATNLDYKMGLDFAIKAELKTNSAIVIGIFMLISVFYLGFIIRTCEL